MRWTERKDILHTEYTARRNGKIAKIVIFGDDNFRQCAGTVVSKEDPDYAKAHYFMVLEEAKRWCEEQMKKKK